MSVNSCLYCKKGWEQKKNQQLYKWIVAVGCDTGQHKLIK